MMPEKLVSLEMKPSLAIFISCNWSICAALNDDTCSMQSSLLPGDKFSEHSQSLFFTSVILPECRLSHLCIFNIENLICIKEYNL